MTGEQYREELERLDLTTAECMRIFGYSRRTELRWRTYGPPDEVAALLVLADSKSHLIKIMNGAKVTRTT